MTTQKRRQGGSLPPHDNIVYFAIQSKTLCQMNCLFLLCYSCGRLKWFRLCKCMTCNPYFILFYFLFWVTWLKNITWIDHTMFQKIQKQCTQCGWRFYLLKYWPEPIRTIFGFHCVGRFGSSGVFVLHFVRELVVIKVPISTKWREKGNFLARLWPTGVVMVLQSTNN
jgi:hypothetical protein